MLLIYQYIIIINNYLVIKEELLSVSAERQKELETLQEVTASLMLRLRERNKQFEALRQNLKGNCMVLVTSHYMTLLLDLAFRPKISKPATYQGLVLEETQTQSSQEETPLITETTGTNTIHCPLYTIYHCKN